MSPASVSVMQMEEGYKQIVYGVVIIAMLLSYGRVEQVQARQDCLGDRSRRVNRRGRPARPPWTGGS